jgi:hypothetical protein
MHKKILWSLGIGFVALMISQKHTYWSPATYAHDLRITVSYGASGILAGLCIANLVLEAAGGRQLVFRICYWAALGGTIGMILVSGSKWTLSGFLYLVLGGIGIGLLCGIAQYIANRLTGRVANRP